MFGEDMAERRRNKAAREKIYKENIEKHARFLEIMKEDRGPLKIVSEEIGGSEFVKERLDIIVGSIVKGLDKENVISDINFAMNHWKKEYLPGRVVLKFATYIKEKYPQKAG